MFKQAREEMDGLTKIVQNEVEAQISRHLPNLLHAVKLGIGTNPAAFHLRARSVGFMHAKQPVLASGPQLTTNVRIMASEEPFHTIASMVEDMERRRDTSEDFVRTRILELELKLLQAENTLVSERLGGWIEHILQTGV